MAHHIQKGNSVPLTELIQINQDFQHGRKGLREVNTAEYLTSRIQDELVELVEALASGNLEEAIEESIDLTLFAGAILRDLFDRLQIDPSDADWFLQRKLAKNYERYNEDHFNLVGQLVGGKEFTVFDALQRARDTHKRGSWDANDIY